MRILTKKMQENLTPHPALILLKEGNNRVLTIFFEKGKEKKIKRKKAKRPQYFQAEGIDCFLMHSELKNRSQSKKIW